MSNVETFRRVFAEAGLPSHVVDGIIANFIWESGGGNDINTGNTTGDGGTSWGAAQWRGDRRTALLDFARQRGTDWTDPETQALFTLHELSTTEGRAFERVMATGNPADATRAFMEAYERPGIPHLEGRLELAASLSGQPMAYTGQQSPPAGQRAIDAATGPGQDVAAPAGSQRLFRPVAEARAARQAGGTPRLDEISNIIQQRRQGMNPLRERLQQFFQQRGTPILDALSTGVRDAAPTPPAPIPGRGGSAGGGNASIRQIQEQLAAAGYDPGPIDGLMGPRTRAAVQQFQQANGLQVDGDPGPLTQAALARGGASVPLPAPRPEPAQPPNAPARFDWTAPIPQASGGGMPTGPAPGSLPGRGTMASPPNAQARLDWAAPAPRPPTGAGMPTGPTPGSLTGMGVLSSSPSMPGNGMGVPTVPVSRGVLPPLSNRRLVPTGGLLPSMPLDPYGPAQTAAAEQRMIANQAPPEQGPRMVRTTNEPPPSWMDLNQIMNGTMPAARNDFMRYYQMVGLPSFNEVPNLTSPNAIGGQQRSVPTSTLPPMGAPPINGIPPAMFRLLGIV